MSGVVSLKAVGDWSAQIEVPLSNALSASIELMGWSGRKACEKALVYMAKSAGSPRHNLTKAAKKNRPTMTGEYGKYVEYWNQKGGKAQVYKWAVEKQGRTWDQAREIHARGLARRSWMWGLAGLTQQDSKVMPGVGFVTEELSPTQCGLTLTNKLGYISQVISPTLQATVSDMASRSILAQSARRAEKRFGIEVPRLAASRARKQQRRLDREFKAAKGGMVE